MTEEDCALLCRAYDMFRTARLSALYYERKLWLANVVHLSFEITIALGATGTGVAAWALWKQGIGVILWGIITGASTLLAIVKPIIAPAKRIELCTRQHQGWHSFYFALDKLLFTIRQEGALSRDLRKRFDTLFDRMVALQLDDEKCPSERLLRRLQPKVARAIPPESLWMPSSPADDSHPARTSPDVVPITTGSKACPDPSCCQFDQSDRRCP
jgi:hypothetical protein